jgi:xanthine dehydrogenase accessory factor
MGMDGWAFLEHGADLARRGESFALATVVWRQGPSSGKESCRAIVTASGELHGWIGGACAEPVVIRQAREVIAEGVPRLLLLGPADQFSESQLGPTPPDGMIFVPISCSSEGSLEVYIEPCGPAPHLVVVGHSPMAQTLGELARALGWRADVIAGQDFTAGQASERSIVVVATQGHYDEEAITAAIEARPAYIGLVGSARRGQTVLGYLAERGLPRAELDRVHSPAGLDLGRTTHQEIAVAILAELVQLRAAGQLASPEASVTTGVSEVRGASRAGGASGGIGTGGASEAGGTGAIEDAVDPMCGMTVTAGPGSHPLERDGVTHYFCCVGCRDAFEKDESRC